MINSMEHGHFEKLLKKFPPLYGTRTFITVHKRAPPGPYPLPGENDHSLPIHFFKAGFNITLTSTPRSSMRSHSFRFSIKILHAFLLLPIKETDLTEGDNTDCGLLGCEAEESYGWLPTFWRNRVHPL
jgi:hypothetical protein